MSKNIITWKGKPIEELSKEELIQALNWAMNEMNRMREEHHRRLDLFRDLRNLNR